MMLNKVQDLTSELQQMYLIQKEDIDQALILNLIYNRIKSIMTDHVLLSSCDRDVFLTVGRVLEVIEFLSDAEDKELGVVRDSANKFLPQVSDDYVTECMKKIFEQIYFSIKQSKELARSFFEQLGNLHSCFATFDCKTAFSLLIEKAFDEIIAQRIHKQFCQLLFLHVHSGMSWGFLAVSG